MSSQIILTLKSWKAINNFRNNLKSFCGKKNTFNCTGIRARVIRLPVNCSNQLSYTGALYLFLTGEPHCISFLHFNNFTILTVTFQLNHHNCKIIKMPKRNITSFSYEKGMSDACVAQLVRAVDRQSKDLGSNPGTVKSVFFSTERF